MDTRYDHIKSEQNAQKLWEEQQTYAFSAKKDKPIYSIDTPPPTVSGTLHIGHVFSYTHADIIARYKRMQNFNVFYPMGFDDNGLATERFVEKKNKTKSHLMKRSEFIALCLKEVTEAEAQFIKLWKSIGLSVDWNHVYTTISDPVKKVSQHSFLELYKKNYVFRQHEPALYCTTCRTSVAQAEIDNIEISSTFNDIEFQTEDGQKLIIATTRPELLPACVALIYHPDDTRHAHLNGKYAVTPVFNKKVKILPDAKVNPEKGSGLVMCCTFGDQMDVYWYKIHKLPFIQVVGFDGKWTKEGGVLEGLTVHDARKKTLELLTQAGKLISQKAITHAVNAHERCKNEIEYLILSQWFIKILEHKEKFLELADNINWKPAFMKARYRDWVEHLNWDWCISRQLSAGIPFPAWHCQDCAHIIFAQEKDLPVDPRETACPSSTCPKCSSTNIRPDTDIMDTWNTSSLTPQININWPDHINPEQAAPTIPMNMRPQAHDIIRTWAFYTIVKAYYHHNKIPWENIVISGHVLAGKEKISKSKGNEKMTPEALLATYPADVIRFWSASGKIGMDTAFSENQLQIGQKLVTKLWNAFRFCAEHIQNYDKQEIKRDKTIDPINNWLLHTLSITFKIYKRNLDDYEYSDALETIEQFFWKTFCDNYLELIKDRFFNPDKYSPEIIDATRFTLYEVGFAILQLYAPFLPHITETLYQMLFKKTEQTNSIHISYLDSARFSYSCPQDAQLAEKILEIVAHVRKLKSEKSLSLKTEIQTLTIYAQDQALLDMLNTQTMLLSGITKAITIEYKKETGKITEILGENDKFNATIQV